MSKMCLPVCQAGSGEGGKHGRQRETTFSRESLPSVTEESELDVTSPRPSGDPSTPLPHLFATCTVPEIAIT